VGPRGGIYGSHGTGGCVGPRGGINGNHGTGGCVGPRGGIYGSHGTVGCVGPRGGIYGFGNEKPLFHAESKNTIWSILFLCVEEYQNICESSNSNKVYLNSRSRSSS
jgi:hypothetical protein